MAISSSIAVTRYTPRDRHLLFDLIDSQYRVHIHMDWLTIDRLLDDPDPALWLAWQGDTVIGLLGAAPPLIDATWVRLAAVHDAFEIGQVLPPLWDALRAHMDMLGVHRVGLLAQREWVGQLGPLFGMTEVDRIVTFQRSGNTFPESRPLPVRIVPGELEDLDTALAIDHAAFDPLWQLSRPALREAIRQSAAFTLALINGQPVAYQISTLYTNSGHLARLATDPAWQGQGVGGLLIGHLITRFAQRRINVISVNTQQTNQQSQRLYRTYGFIPSGLDIPVWKTEL